MRKIKRILTLLVACVLCFGAMSFMQFTMPQLDLIASADDLTYGDLSYQIMDDGLIWITKCNEKASGKIVIPSEIDGVAVKGVNMFAFVSCYDLEELVISDGVTVIGAYALSWCTSLKKITLPSSITDIGCCAFYACDNLKDVYYMGTETQWSAIDIDSIPFSIYYINDENGNQRLLDATIHYTNTAAGGSSALSKGDLNGDGIVNTADIVAVMVYAAQVGAGLDGELTVEQAKAADVDENGVVDSRDSSYMLSYAAFVGVGANPKWSDIIA